MKFTFYKHSFRLCFCAIFCFAATGVRARAQSQQQQPVLLVLKDGLRELRVFDDGTAVESHDSKITERRLTEARMRKLREVIARRPCVREPQQQPASSTPTLVLKEITQVTLDHLEKDDCITSWRSSYDRGLTEIQVTIRSPAGQNETTPVYAVCDGAKEIDKKYVKRNYQSWLKPNWHRFIADASKAVGVKSFLKGCDRQQY